ncbi:hypothetical protein M758_3G210200 [Ceratodon purpureus]|nr:hypothetical protein M758_3G210200 [Ceratodon purpureus]
MIQLPARDERQSIAFAVPKKSVMSDSQPLTSASHLGIVILICILHIQELINRASERRHLVLPNAKCHNSSCTTLELNWVNKSCHRWIPECRRGCRTETISCSSQLFGFHMHTKEFPETRRFLVGLFLDRWEGQGAS